MVEDEQRNALQDALQAHDDVLLAYLFGSHATGRAHDNSDVDVAILHDSDDQLQLRLDLMRTLSPIVHTEVDVVPLNTAHPRLINQVLHNGQPLYEQDEATRVAFETRARARYLDMKPRIDAYHEAVEERLRA